jgi:hypothetical protein
MSYGLQLLGNARSVRGDQFRRPEFDRQGRIVGHSETDGLSPSMRRPVDVKAHFRFLLSVSLFPFSQAAPVAILPSALFVERYSLGARWVFSFQ